ncbi:hypothetical protein RSAG8_05362, partial [Rhizoctonia solani AG-8 WAC10335]
MTNSRVGLHVGLTSLALVLLWRLIRRPKIRYPPSPLSLPFLGNVFSIPSGHEYIAFEKLGGQLKSDIIHLEVLGHKIIILNSAEAALDVLEKRSAFHSDRPPLPMVTDPTLMNWPGLPSIVGYNDLWRHYRRMMNNWLNARAVTQFNDLQERQARLLLQRLLSATNHVQPFEHVRNEFFFAMASSIFQLAYGYRLKDPQDQFFKDSQRAFHNVTVAGMQTNFLVNIFPALSYIPDWFPGTDWKRTAREWRAHQIKAKTEPYEWMKAQIANGTYQPSVLGSLIQDHKLLSGLSPSERDERLKEIGIVIFGTNNPNNPAYLHRWDRYVRQFPCQPRGRDGFEPTCASQGSTRAGYRSGSMCFAEYLRQGDYPFFPQDGGQAHLTMYPLHCFARTTAIPHACFQDDVYRGYDIQKGTTMAIGRDPRDYEDPETFSPDRYLDPDIPRSPVFGWGRRKCPGIHFAETSIFITTALLLSVFTFSKRRDHNGKEIVPKVELEANSIVLELEPFDFEFQPRSDAHHQLILGAINE